MALPVDAETERVVVTNPAASAPNLCATGAISSIIRSPIGSASIASRPTVSSASLAVNLLDPAESDIRPRAEKSIQLGYTKVVASKNGRPVAASSGNGSPRQLCSS